MVGGNSDLVALLTSWLPRQRWFAGKGRPWAGLRVVRNVRLSDLLHHFVVEVRYADGGLADHYQIPLVVRPDAPYGHEAFFVGKSADGLIYDGLHDPDGSAALLAFIRGRTAHDGLVPYTLEELELFPAHVIGAEQSNTSVVYGDAYILKVFRRLWPGTNPDLEMTRALADAGSPSVARPLAWLDGVLDGQRTTFAFMQEFLRSGTEGWRLALASVRDLYAEADLHADEVGGDFAAESERLGAATADVHRIIAETLPTAVGDAETLRAQATGMHSRLDAAIRAVEQLRAFETGLRAAYDELARQTSPVALQRVHGDYHLGQVLRVDSGWVLFDFEGEPARPLAERTALQSVHRDVAGMLRSFDYAAQSLLLERSLLVEREDESGLRYRAQEWATRNRDAFCAGYASVRGHDPREEAALLRAFELDKAVYEVVYEARHRPSWLPIPLGSVERLTSTD
ncbi:MULTISPECIES: maltokinase N-terminal cap-like domain-containing protein [Protofrankia]|uniref:Maltokinase n=1 Tax=Protofrankia coriariae TaxID=1562887 RepID=A0ABR5F7N9_9ACTN|nr:MULTISPECIES: phosphotransferase [Protofrankia]KLL12744.1 aminoglycoside phosphotransferase [Protofrankia coriariae]ONH36086.1 aminoglycoside phosphotransferase [Protofrankia sp. BMG5.30]